MKLRVNYVVLRGGRWFLQCPNEGNRFHYQWLIDVGESRSTIAELFRLSIRAVAESVAEKENSFLSFSIPLRPNDTSVLGGDQIKSNHTSSRPWDTALQILHLNKQSQSMIADRPYSSIRGPFDYCTGFTPVWHMEARRKSAKAIEGRRIPWNRRSGQISRRMRQRKRQKVKPRG